jgi:hypothetical protein
MGRSRTHLLGGLLGGMTTNQTRFSSLFSTHDGPNYGNIDFRSLSGVLI